MTLEIWSAQVGNPTRLRGVLVSRMPASKIAIPVAAVVQACLVNGADQVLVAACCTPSQMKWSRLAGMANGLIQCCPAECIQGPDLKAAGLANRPRFDEFSILLGS
jgi:hypothetical protein